MLYGKAAVSLNSVNGGFVRLAVIEPLECCAPLAKSASGKLHCGVVIIRQWPVWAVSDDMCWGIWRICCEAENGRNEPMCLMLRVGPKSALLIHVSSVGCHMHGLTLPLKYWEHRRNRGLSN